jgi:hypothetical protein
VRAGPPLPRPPARTVVACSRRSTSLSCCPAEEGRTSSTTASELLGGLLPSLPPLRACHASAGSLALSCSATGRRAARVFPSLDPPADDPGHHRRGGAWRSSTPTAVVAGVRGASVAAAGRELLPPPIFGIVLFLMLQLLYTVVATSSWHVGIVRLRDAIVSRSCCNQWEHVAFAFSTRCEWSM